jgi:hypothetical protein
VLRRYIVRFTDRMFEATKKYPDGRRIRS